MPLGATWTGRLGVYTPWSRSGVVGGIVGARICDSEDATSCTHDVSLDKPCALCAETAEQSAAGDAVKLCPHDIPVNMPCLICDGATEDPDNIIPDHEPVENEHLLYPHDDELKSIKGGKSYPAKVLHSIWSDPDQDQVAEDAALDEMQREDSGDDTKPVIYTPVIYIISNSDPSHPQIMGTFNHDNGSYEIMPALSTTTEHFDDIIENDGLIPIFGEEAFDILMTPVDEGTTVGDHLVVRNTLLNVDFIISY